MTVDLAQATPAVSCSEGSAAASEVLAGSASQGARWLILERNGAWGRDAVADSQLPVGVREVLESFDGRALLVRRPDRRGTETAVFLAETTESGGVLVRRTLVELEGLAVPAAADGDEPLASPLFLVCAHGRRDACCAKLGTPVYESLSPHVDSALLWQSSHHGGHRFAANVLALPAGVQLGRVAPADAKRVAALLQTGRIPLDLYRGRTLYPPHVQAAEVEIRRLHGLDSIGALALHDDDGENVTFRVPGGDTTVAVQAHPGPVVPLSCGAQPEPTTAYSVRW
jgi:hypothetical protein